MLSRVAENIYWMSRYIERAENIARVVSVNANLQLDLPRGVAAHWRAAHRHRRGERSVRGAPQGLQRAAGRALPAR